MYLTNDDLSPRFDNFLLPKNRRKFVCSALTRVSSLFLFVQNVRSKRCIAVSAMHDDLAFLTSVRVIREPVFELFIFVFLLV